ncbi:uncharacterized protein F4807DRAFT_243911 [Annulohypoxylon truncatum]|uniref:uncharacterized protein n=1 Tax=Annulohypoxylon truncatum TaxID=327061 RepID=UPI0020085123|nr:uncharacterized protein F4807DRAFT_243911 [Annulohypoxylon truncatum]KAI1206054.1 hypothetical protein F4807DRAFT_243911 [Annulohypoxylon truncatum]
MSQVTSSSVSTGPGHPPQPQSQPGSQTLPTTSYSGNNSQDTTASNTTDRIFTPPESDSEGSNGVQNGHASSQESQSQLQLLQLSQLAAAQQKINEIDGTPINGQSKKRMADGVVKHTRNSSSVSPVRVGHSRNTSTVSVASTAGSRIGELSAELRTKLSYAMVKVNNGWQGHSIDEVESLASQAASPTSSTSTLHGRHGASASPRIPIAPTRHRASSNVTSPTFHHPSQGRTYESFWREGNMKGSTATSPISQVPTLAPPAPIQPRQPGQVHPRRSSNARFAPAYLSHHASPHTPAQPSPLQSTPGQANIRTPNVDPILFSPHQNVREQEALETLMFMSSPGNSANVKHTFPSSLPPSQSSQPAQGRSSGRTALPTSRLGSGVESSSQGRKSLPTARPQTQTQTQTHHAPQVKRVGFEKSPGNYGGMDIDDPHGSPYNRGTPRRRTNGSAPRPSLSIPAGLGGSSRPRTALRGDDIERMLDRVAADDSSDSEGEIHLPPSRRANGPPVGV